MRRFPSSWFSTLEKLGYKRRSAKPRPNRLHGYGRRPTLELLESRQLLTGTPWIGTDVLIGDFNGDGNLDRLGSTAVSSISPEIWSIDTKSSSAAGNTEDWRVIRPNGYPAAGVLPTPNESVVGDFNGDGRDDILSRTGMGWWYVIHSRASSKPTTYQGEFEFASWGPISISNGWSTPVVGDFDGDGRDDLAAFNDSNPADKQWQVMRSTGSRFEAVETWAQGTTAAPITSSRLVGDFNGDGRDDIAYKKTGSTAWTMAISDGSRFNIADPNTISTTWTASKLGDFDGNKADEILGWNPTLARWEIVNYSDRLGMGLDTSWGNALGSVASTQNVHIGDANRDGRDDLVIFDTTGNLNKWKVALSQKATDGTNKFVYTAADVDGTNDWFKNWDWGPAATSYRFLNVDAPYQEFVDIFSNVYNTIELELYPGFMKGLTATAQTKSANPWEQAALLVDRLESAGFSTSDVEIASGTVEVPVSVLKSWLGLESNLSVYNAIRLGLDGNAVALNSVGVNLSANSASVINAQLSKVRFRHAWVQAKVPTALGWTAVNIDPSWKFKDFQPGFYIDLSGSSSPYPGNRGTFDEFDYLAKEGDQLPLEYYENRVAEILAANNVYASLAEVPHDGPIIQRHFTTIPSGLVSEVVLTSGMTTYNNFAAIVADPGAKIELTHRVEVSLKRDATSQKLRRAFDLDGITQLPDYAAFEPSLTTSVGLSTTSVSSYGEQESSAVGVVGQIRDLKQTAFFPNPYPTQGGPNPPMGGFGNFIASDYTINSGSGAPGEIWFQKAAAYAIELSDPYDFTANTRLEFDIEQSGSASYNPTFVVGVTRYSTGANPLPMSYDFYLIDGTSYANYTGEHSVNVTHSSGQLHVSIPAGAFASDNPAQYQTRITILHSDNVVRSLRESGNQSTQNGAGRTTIRNLFLREESPYDFTVQGNELQLTGTSFVAAAANYVLSPDSIIEFEFLSTSAGDRHIIGWDVNGVPDSSNTDSSTLIAFFGNDVSNSPYTGNGWEKIRIPLASYFSGTGTQSLGNIIFGVEGGANSGATSYFRNIKLFDGSTTLEGSGTSRKIIQSGFTSKALPASMTLTRRTLLQFTFNVVQEGRFHGIGIDYDNSADNGGNYDRLFYLSGTNPPTGLELIPITGSPFHGTGARTVSIPIGDYVGNVDWLDRIVFVSEGGKVEFSDISIVEGAENAYTHWSEEIVVPATPQGQAAHDVRIRYEGAPVGQFQAYIPYLSVNGDSYAGTGNSNGSFFAGESSTINVQHWFPTALAKPADLSNLNRLNSYSRTANQVHALVIDANQYSTAYIAQLQYELNEQQLDIFRRRTEGGAISDVEVKDSIGALLSYVGSKYWHEVNFSTGSINGLLQTVGAQQRIGSGLITSDAQWIADPNVGHLNLPNVPRNLGVDFPNVTHNSLDIWTGPVSHSSEAFQLIGYNSSALESAILEEVVNTKSISTIRGLKESYAATVSGDHVWVFESRLVDGQRKIYRRGSIGATPDANDPYEFTGGDELTASQIRTGAGLSAHSQLVRDLLAAMLENANQQYGASDAVITVTIPHRKSIVDNWAGSVYLAEIVSSSGRNGRYVIAPDNGPISSGGYIGGVFKPENNRLSKGTFLNETYAGDPVNVANGNMFRDDVDFTFANPVIPLDFARHYDTQNKLDVGFGVGWVHSFTGFIYEENDPANSGDKDYIWLRGNGERHTFENLNFKLPNTLFGDIETNNGPVDNKRLTAFKDRSGTQYIFEPLASAFTDTVTGKKVYGRLIAIKDATGNQGVTITYEPGNSLRVAKVSSIATTGRSLDFVYSANSVEVRRVDGGQLASTWAYVLATHAGYTGKRLTQVKHANQSSTTTTYTHYTDGPASRKGLIKEIIEPNGESHSYEYYANGRVFRVTDGSSNQQSFNYNLFRNLTEFTDERGNVETYIHQDNGLLTKQIHNDRSRLEFTWGPQTGTGPVQWEEFLMKSSTDERGGTEIFTYYTFDPNNATSRPGELQTSRAKDGVLTTYEYANHAYISSVKKTTVTPLTGPSIVTSQQTYDPNGRILTTTDAEEHTTSYEYFAATAPAHLRGLRKSETQAKGVPGQSLSTWEGNEAVGWETLTNSFTITGDTIAVRLLSSNVLGEWVRADAIRIDRLDKDKVYSRVIDDTTGTNRSFRLESTTYTLDTDGAYGGFHVRFNGGTAQPVATWIFDDLEPGTYRISASWPYSTANDPTTSYQLFDDLPDGTPNQVVTGIDQLAPADSFRNYQTLFEYDTAGNVTRSITEALPAGRRAYDSFGNVVYEEDATGAATAYTYDTLGRLTTSSVVAPKAFKFTPQDVVSYGPAPGWDVDPTSWEVQNGGDTLYIYNGARKAVPFSYRVTANTVLEFDFEAIGNLAEVHGIGFSNALATVTAKTFALGGTNPSGWIPEFDWTFATYKKDSGQRHFRIPVGQILAAGTYNYLAFVNYDSGNYDIGTLPTGLAKEGKSYFSNLRIYESATSSSIPYKDIEFTPSNVLSNGIGIGLDEDPNSWKVLDEGRTLHLFDGARKAVPLYYQVTPQTVLEFDFKADGNLAELHGVGLTHSLGVQTTRTFAVAGTSPNTWMPEVNWSFKNYSPGSGVRHFRIPVGQFVSAGMYEYLAFVNYDHGNTPLGSPQEEGKSYFSNVRLHEGSGLPSVNTTTHTYDASGRLKATTDGIGRTTTFDYDGNGRLIRTAFADGTFTTHEYDELGNCIAITDELGHTTHHVYDDRNRVVQTIYPDGKSTRTRYDGVGQIVTTIDEREVESAFTFDKVGRLLTTIAAKNATEQAKTVNKYDGLGRRIESVDGEGNVTKYLYDDRDRLIQTTVLDTTHISPSDTTLTPVQPNKAPVYVSTIEYDANGSIARTAVFDPRLFGSADYSNLISNAASLIDTSNEEANKVQVVRFAYNALGRSTKVTNADGKPTSTTYDAAGRVRFTFDELGRKTEHLYDAYGRLQKIIQPDPDGAGPGERPYVRYVRNAAGEMIYEAEYVGPGHLGSPDLFETVREFAYDERGRSIFLRDKTGIVAARHAYDAAGKLVSTIDAERNASLRTYDERGRVLAERAADPDGAGKQIAPVTRYAYDPAGNLAATTDPLGNTTEFAYDKLNRRVTESHTQTLIVDDVEGGSSSFSTMPSSAAETATGASSAFGNDATYFVPNGSEIRQAEWTFTDLDAGDYVISLSSFAVIFSPGTTLVEVLVGGTPFLPASSSLSQLTAANEYRSIHGESDIAWRRLPVPVPVPAGGSIKLRLSTNGGSLLADAVRIDRIVSESFGYDKNGNRTSATDTRGNATTYVYDELNRVRQTISADPDGAAATLRSLITESTYDGYGSVVIERQGHLTSTTTYDTDRTNTFKYDQRNRLTEKVVDAGAGRLNVTTHYRYDSVGYTTDVTNALGDETHFRYDNLNRVIDEYQDFGEGRTDALFTDSISVTPYTLDPPGQPNITFNSGASFTLSGYASKKLAVNHTVKYNTVLEFEFRSHSQAEVHLVGFDANGTLEQGDLPFMFDLTGTTTIPGTNREFRVEHVSDEVVRFHIPIGQYLSDAQKLSGLPINFLTFTNVDNRNWLAMADRSDSTFSNIRLYDSDEVRTVTTYDLLGNVETVREASDPRNITTRYEYDRLSRLVRTDFDDGGPQEIVHTRAYDTVGNLIEERNNTAGTVTIHVYDRLNRRIKSTLPDPDANPATFNGLINQFTYDAVGNVVKQEQKAIQVVSNVAFEEATKTIYDSFGRIIVETDGNGDETHYRYDSEGNLLSVTDAEQNTTSYKYDRLNRVTEETNAHGTRRFEYSKAGNLDRLYNRISGQIQFSYDTLDRKIAETWRIAAPGSTVQRFLNWQYDKLGRITKQVDGNTQTEVNVAGVWVPNTADDIVDTFVYDGLGRLIEERNYDPATLAIEGQNSDVPRVRQTYRFVVEPTSSGTFVDRTYRDQFASPSGTEVIVAQTQFQSDRLGRLTDQQDSDPNAAVGPAPELKHLRFTYDPTDTLHSIKWFGNFAAGNWTNTATSGFGYDGAQRLTSLSFAMTSAPALVTHTYGYNNASRVTSFNTTGSGAATRSFAYDKASQLTSKTGSSGNEAYTYDDNGNRVAVGAQTIVTGLANRLINDGTYGYIYDNEGNVVRRVPFQNISASNPVVNYFYDRSNRLASVMQYATWSDAEYTVNGVVVGQNAIHVINYTYDAQGRRVRRSIDADGGTPNFTHETFIYSSAGASGNELTMRFTGGTGAASVLTHRYMHGPDGQALVDEVFNAAGQSTEVLWLLTDQQGTVRDVVNDNGVLRKHVDYDSFGKVTGEQFYALNGTAVTSTHAEAIEQLFGYTGQERDKTTGLQKHGARWYNPSTARWLSEDPIAFAGGDPNLYRYVGNSPLNAIDPTGLIQAGNPLSNLNLFAGGYSGGSVSAYKPPSPYVASGGGLSLGTLGSVIGNSIFNAAASYVAPETKTAIGTLNVASSIASTGGFLGDSYDAFTGYSRGVKDSIDRSFKSAYNGVAYAVENPLGAIGSVASGAQNTLFTALDYTIGWTAEHKRNQNIRSIEHTYNTLHNEFNRLKDASVYEQARTIGDVVGTGGQAFVPATTLARTTRVTSTLRLPAIGDDVAQRGAISQLTVLNGVFVPDSKKLLQQLSNQAYADISMSPRKALQVLTDKEYRQLVYDGRFADAQFGNAIERLVASTIEEDARFSSILVHSSPARHHGQFVRTPDFVGIEGSNYRAFDLTTIGEVPVKLKKPGSGAVEYVIQPGKGSINFK